MAAAAGGGHSAEVGEDGSLFVWGSGEDGQLGTGDTADGLAPTRVAGLPAPVRLVRTDRPPRAVHADGPHGASARTVHAKRPPRGRSARSVQADSPREASAQTVRADRPRERSVRTRAESLRGYSG